MDERPQRRKPYTLYRVDGARAARGRRRRKRRAQRVITAAGMVVALALVVTFILSATGLVSGPWSGDRGAAHQGSNGTQADAKAGNGAAGGAAGAPTGSTPAPSAAGRQRFTLTAGGDVMGGFAVAGQLRASGARVFAALAPWFKKSDLAFVNLESPITAGGDPQTWKDVVIKGDPALAPAMARSGINVVTMANNHAVDQGESGLRDTFAAVRAQHITLVGAGTDLARAQAGRVKITRQGVKVAFLGFTDVLPKGYAATAATAGVSPGRSDLGAVTGAIRAAARRAPFVIVGWHWNFELKTAPSTLESQEGHAAVDAGADIVLAHHPHVLDGVERYHHGLIFYSLGNLVFSGQAATRAETMLVRASVTPHRINARLIPVLISPEGIPSIATGADAARILQRVKRLSADLGTHVRIDGDYGWVSASR